MDMFLDSPSGSVFQENHVSQAITENLNNVISRKAIYIDKLVFYAEGEKQWEEVAKSSQQRGEIVALGSVKDSVGRGSTVIEIGPGDFEKTSAAFTGDIAYYIAVDCNEESLKEHIPKLAMKYPQTKVQGICTTFEKACALFAEQASLRKIDRENTILWSFGSTIANYEYEGVIEIFRTCSMFAVQMWIGQDGTQDKDEIERSYHTRQFKEFISCGLQKLDEDLEKSCSIKLSFADHAVWQKNCSFESKPVCHKWTIKALQDIGNFEKGDTVYFMACYKYQPETVRDICEQSGWNIETCFQCDANVVYKIKSSGGGGGDGDGLHITSGLSSFGNQ